LAFIGGALGLLLAYAALRLLVHMGPANLPRLDEISIDSSVLLFTLVISLAAGVLFGLIPVFKYAGRASKLPSARVAALRVKAEGATARAAYWSSCRLLWLWSCWSVPAS